MQSPMQPEQIPDEARVYLAALEAQKEHPLVASHFFQVTWFTWFVAKEGKVEFYALEFRVGLNVALIWNDGEGNWKVELRTKDGVLLHEERFTVR